MTAHSNESDKGKCVCQHFLSCPVLSALPRAILCTSMASAEHLTDNGTYRTGHPIWRESRAITILKFPFADIFTHQEQWQLRLHSISNFTALANWERRVLCSRTCCGSLFTLCLGNLRNKLPCPNGISCNSCHTTYEHSWLATCRRVLYYLWQRISTETTKKWANDWITSSTEY